LWDGVVHDERCLVQRQLLDASEAIRRFQCKNCARGLAREKRRPTRLALEHCDVFDRALQGIGRRITTAASASTVVGEDGEVLCQELTQLPTPILCSLRFKLLRETLAFHVSRVCLYLAFEARQFTVLILGYIAVQSSGLISTNRGHRASHFN